MKFNVPASLLLFFFSLAIEAADHEDSKNGNDLLEEISESEESDFADINIADEVKVSQACIDQLKTQFSGYKVYLHNFFGCGLCRCLNGVFNQKTSKHIEGRKLQVQFFEIILGDYSKQCVTRFRDIVHMIDFQSDMGKSFKQSCLNTVALHCPDLPKKVEADANDEHNCIICFDQRKTIAAKPCGHTLYCEECLQKGLKTYKSRFANCATCRQKVTRYNKIKIDEKRILDTCVACSKNEARIIGAICGHVALCEPCHKNSKDACFCPICLESEQKFLKFYQ